MVIRNNTITYCHSNEGGGIYAGSASVYNNTIEYCSTYGWGGGGICGGSVIENNTIKYCFADVVPDQTDGWGGIGGGIRSHGGIIRHNTIEENSSLNYGSAIGVQWGSPQIINNTIRNNTFDYGTLVPTPASGIGCEYCDDILIDGNIICDGEGGDAHGIGISCCDNAIIKNNMIYNNQGDGIHWDVSGNLEISNCSIINNSDTGIDIDSEGLIRNCIISNNGNCGIRVWDEDIEIIFTNVWNNGYDGQQNYYNCNPGQGCIEENPHFADPTNGDYSLAWNDTVRSPCIDTGDPDEQYNDYDESRSDMGARPAIWHKYDNWQLPPNSVDDGWKWLSFPALDDLTNAPDFDGDMAEYMLADILDEEILDSVIWKPILEQNSDLEKIQYIQGDWTNPDHIFTSPQGYKFNMSDNLGDYVDLEISGFLENKNTVIHLWGNLKDNWIGYFLEETQTIEDAFGDAMDNISSIHMQHWEMKRKEMEPEAPWIIPKTREEQTVQYGDMLIVQCFDDMDFQWYKNGNVQPHEETKTSYFTFTEQADYVPIYVELDPEDIPDEIGVLVDGECKGASVVEDTLSQICAYIIGCNGELEFELYYDNKGNESDLNVKDYFVYNPETKLKEKRTIKVDENKEYYLVSFKADESETIPEHFSIQNFPNPFNPDIIGTTIQYALPKETDVTITIYNIKGQLVKRIVKGMQSPGIYNVIWNGKDETGKSISNGIYFYQLSTDNKTLIKKMLLLR